MKKFFLYIFLPPLFSYTILGAYFPERNIHVSDPNEYLNKMDQRLIDLVKDDGAVELNATINIDGNNVEVQPNYVFNRRITLDDGTTIFQQFGKPTEESERFRNEVERKSNNGDASSTSSIPRYRGEYEPQWEQLPMTPGRFLRGLPNFIFSKLFLVISLSTVCLAYLISLLINSNENKKKVKNKKVKKAHITFSK